MFERFTKPKQEENKENPEAQNKVEQYLKVFDFEKLKLSFRKVLERSGLSQKEIDEKLEKIDIDFVILKTKKAFKDENAAGEMVRGKYVLLNTENELNLNNEFLDHVLIHEFVHLLAQVESKNLISKVLLKQPSGLEHQNLRESPLFQGMNEALTDMLTNYMYKEYKDGEQSKVKAYEIDKNIFILFCRKISEVAGVSEDVVVKGMVRAYFSNQKDFYTFLDEITKEAESDPELAELIKSVRHSSSVDVSDQEKLKSTFALYQKLFENNTRLREMYSDMVSRPDKQSSVDFVETLDK